ADRCFVCHGPDPRARKASLRLDTRQGAVDGGAIDPDDLAGSALGQRITATHHKRMPPPKANLALSKGEIDTPTRWVKQGAEDKAAGPSPPCPAASPARAVERERGAGPPLARSIRAGREREKCRPPPPAPREGWVRRVPFDLTGLPPTPEEGGSFLADTRP